MPIILEKDDLFHAPPNDTYTWTETNWFGMMFIPDKKLQFDIYVWFHPNLKVAYAGMYVMTGVKKDQLAAEYFDFRSWLPMPTGNLDNYALENGLSVKILRPLTTYQIDYVDAARSTELHVVWDAIMPPIPFPMGEHLEQAGRVTGTLKLNGEVHRVDCISIRDHSWVHRPETPKLGRRPIGFAACGFDDGTAFCLTLADSNYRVDGVANEAPPWLTQAAALEANQIVPFCWVHKDGVSRQIRAADLRTRRDAAGWRPVGFELDFVDDQGVAYAVRGETENFYPFHWMQNNMITCCLSRFTCNGKHAWGAFFESMEGDVVHKLLK
jgi:hypothetical protein